MFLPASLISLSWSLFVSKHVPHLDSMVTQQHPMAVLDDGEVDHTRRHFIPSASLHSIIPFVAALSQLPSRASPEDDETSTGSLSRDQVAKLLHSVPTFTIVDEKGVPYMVVGEDAKVTAYFFVSYEEASRILKLAISSADQSIKRAKQSTEPLEADQLSNPWKQARISTVPLDTAITLSLQSNGGVFRSYFQIAATDSDIEDALAVTGQTNLAEGKVPLFYYRDYQNDNGNSPLYFNKAQLEDDFRKVSSRGQPLPETQVTELLSVLRLMVSGTNNDEGFERLVFVPPRESERRAKECTKRGGSFPPLVMGKRNIVL